MTTLYIVAACSFSVVANTARSHHLERAPASLCGVCGLLQAHYTAKSLLMVNCEMEPSTAEMSTGKAKIKAVYCVA